MTIHLYTPEHRRRYRMWLKSRTPGGLIISEMEGGPVHRFGMLCASYHFSTQLRELQRIANMDRAELEAMRDRVLATMEGDA